VGEPRKHVFWWDGDTERWDYLFTRRLADEVYLCGEAERKKGVEWQAEDGSRVLIVRVSKPREAQEWVYRSDEWQPV
jgi:hypothetical protein